MIWEGFGIRIGPFTKHGTGSAIVIQVKSLQKNPNSLYCYRIITKIENKLFYIIVHCFFYCPIYVWNSDKYPFYKIFVNMIWVRIKKEIFVFDLWSFRRFLREIFSRSKFWIRFFMDMEMDTKEKSQSQNQGKENFSNQLKH